jgi:iron(III) transport system permease protein
VVPGGEDGAAQRMSNAAPLAIGRPARARDRWWLVSVAGFAVVLAFLAWPLVQVLVTSLLGETGAPALTENYRRVFGHRYYYRSIVNSLVLSTLATIGAVLVGTPLAFAVARYPIPGKVFIRTAANLALLSPPFIGAYSWVVLFGRNGLANRALEPLGWSLPSIYGYPGILLVFVVQYFPFVFLLVSGALRSVDQSLEDAALSLGSDLRRAFRTAILPVIAPSLTAGALLVFMATMADFGTPMIIGEGLRTLPTLMYGEFINELGGNPSMASTLGSLLILVNTTALMAQRYFALRRAYHVVCLQPLGLRRVGRRRRALATALVYAVIGAALLPALTILVSSFMPTRGPVMYAGVSVASYASVLHLVPRAIFNTLALTAAAVALDVALGVLIAYLLARRRSAAHALLDGLVMLAYAIPGTVVGVGLIIAYNRPPLVLTGTWLILLVSYFIRHLPYPVRSCTAMLQQIDVRVEEASISLGVPPFRTFWQVTLPLMFPAILSGATLAWITTVGELSSSILLYSGPWATMSVEIFTQVFSNHFGTASALASILIVAAVVPLFVTYRVLGERSALTL